METKFDITWEVEDGYSGQSRPQNLTVDLDDFDDEMPLDDVYRQLSDIIKEEFMERISWTCDKLGDVAAQIHAALAERAKEEANATND